jgi:hypothetical protein
MFGLKRNGSPIGVPLNVGTRMSSMAALTSSYNHGGDVDSTPELIQYYYIDSPNTTDPVTYQATFLHSTAQTLYTNRTANNADTVASYERLTSNIFVMETL